MANVLPLPNIGDLANGYNLVTQLLGGLLYGGRCIGYQKINVDDQAVYTLTVPAGAQIAILFVDGAATAADPNKVIHWREDGNDPTTGDSGEGMVLADNGILDIRGAANIAAFKMIARDTETHNVRVQYYGQA